jgi:hypothetical protein
MNYPWFKREGPFFIPQSMVGWVIIAAFVAFAVYLFISIDSHSHSVSDTLLNFAFNLLILSLLYSLVAFLFSGFLRKKK